MHALNSFLNQKTDQESNEEMSLIINRLKKFSPTKIKSDLAETYQANQHDLRQVISEMEAEKLEKNQIEEQYKERIRVIQVENIKNM